MGDTASRQVGDNGPRIAAFFDFDSTIVRGDSIIPFTRFLIACGFPTLPQMLHIAGAVFLHHARVYTNNDVKRVFARQFAGYTLPEVDALCREFNERKLTPLVYAMARERIAHHHRQGHRVVVVSASLTCYLDAFGRQLGAADVIGTVLEHREGAYTGRLATPNCIKAEKLNRLRALPGFDKIDLAASHAYSDHIYDLPMLEFVGHPVLVNPEPRLRAVGAQRKWPVETWK